MGRRVVVKAPAKINLYLEVGARRPDGFHEVRTVIQAVEVFDRLDLELLEGGEGIRLEVEGTAPQGEDNLCFRAAAGFLEETGLRLGVRIVLTKNIPEAAGLGGGSSDAAAVLRGLNLLTGEALGREDLFRMAARLGSDVPFFLVGGTVMGEGRGERVKPLAQAPPLPVVLANPGTGLPTSEVYRRYDRLGPVEPPPGGPETLLDILLRGDVRGAAPFLFNALEPAACELLPELRKIMEIIFQEGGKPVVSGSGPTVFVLASDEEEAEKMASSLEGEVPLVYRTRFCNHGAAIVDEGRK